MAKKPDSLEARKGGGLKREISRQEDRTGKRDPFIVLSFHHFDRNQGQSFADWEADTLLALAIEKLRFVCSLTVKEATTQQIIKQYAQVSFPPNSGFRHPRHVPEDVTWCSMHIQGKECVIGYFDGPIFHVVFLDKEHQFWPSKKR